MERKRAYTLIFDGYADWELGYILPELHRLCKIDVAIVGFTDRPVVSMGGLRVIPETVISKVRLDDVLLFILPGGYLWEGPYPAAELDPLLHRLEEARIPVAAICAATTVVARAGLLRDRKHTSNSLTYLSRMVPGYSGKADYVESLATRDRGVVTASGLGPIEFAMEIFDELNVVSPEMRKIWYDAVKHGIYPDNIEHRQ
jgi:putative intracellular protease/amidase